MYLDDTTVRAMDHLATAEARSRSSLIRWLVKREVEMRKAQTVAPQAERGMNGDERQR